MSLEQANVVRNGEEVKYFFRNRVFDKANSLKGLYAKDFYAQYVRSSERYWIASAMCLG
jgi:hypothetical protein